MALRILYKIIRPSLALLYFEYPRLEILIEKKLIELHDPLILLRFRLSVVENVNLVTMRKHK